MMHRMILLRVVPMLAPVATSVRVLPGGDGAPDEPTPRGPVRARHAAAPAAGDSLRPQQLNAT